MISTSRGFLSLIVTFVAFLVYMLKFNCCSVSIMKLTFSSSLFINSHWTIGSLSGITSSSKITSFAKISS